MGEPAGGPWVIDRPKPSEVHVLGREPGSGRLVLVAACETEADARLIAAAPDMLEEIRRLREGLRELMEEAEAKAPNFLSDIGGEGDLYERLRALLPPETS